MTVLENEELEKVSGGTAGDTYYGASVFREGIDEEEVRGYYDSRQEAFDAACELLQINLKQWPDRFFIIRVYLCDRASDTKQVVYEETVTMDDYYKKSNYSEPSLL